MQDVYVIQHVHLFEEGDEDVKFIGVYSSKENAEKAAERLRLQPGFCDTPDAFSIDIYELNEDNWTSGYVTTYHGNDFRED
jgi:hypothetical protein